ncbi:putative glycosyltransferase [Angulomicrobium tetraedrale]|uniref:Putative glycosyltransferase n=1 Tax=Ancylobacter tetraedralis TaxID=217068 RepID=A0A839Z565_9HYPH|nr:putative glycosyltransferase [Ancylobacter tetraedralis]
MATAYNSERHIVRFLKAMRDVLDQIDCLSEIVIVDDGSADRTVEICLQYIAEHPGITLAKLSRNFGHEPAMVQGLKLARGDFVFLIDSDLEEPPATLIEMLEVMGRGAPAPDVVYGVQKTRNGTIQHTFFATAFYRLFGALSDVEMPADVLTVRLMTRRYVDALLLHEERTLALFGVFSLTGFTQVPLLVDKHYKGYTTYSGLKRAGVFIRYLLVFSSKLPLLITATGIGTAFVAALYAFYVLINYVTAGRQVEGWTSLALLFSFFNGLLLTCVGFCAAYLGYIFVEVKRRPNAIIQEIWHSGTATPGTVSVPRLKSPDGP